MLLVDSTIRDRYESKPFALLEATDPYKPSTTRTGRPTRLPAPASRDKPFAEALEDLTQERVGKFHTPVAEWL